MDQPFLQDREDLRITFHQIVVGWVYSPTNRFRDTMVGEYTHPTMRK
jgi:hypothetical protein